MSMDINVGLKINMTFEESQTPWSLWHFVLGVHESDPWTSSTTNHRFYRALEWLHWSEMETGCKVSSRCSPLIDLNSQLHIYLLWLASYTWHLWSHDGNKTWIHFGHLIEMSVNKSSAGRSQCRFLGHHMQGSLLTKPDTHCILVGLAHKK